MSTKTNTQKNMDEKKFTKDENFCCLFGGIYTIFKEDCEEFPQDSKIYTKITQKVLQLEHLTEEEAGYIGSDEATILEKPEYYRAYHCAKVSDSVELLKLFVTDIILNEHTKSVMFRLACANGNLQVAKWIIKQWPEIVNRGRIDWAFCFACENDHDDVSDWLIEQFPKIGMPMFNF